MTFSGNSFPCLHSRVQCFWVLPSPLEIQGPKRTERVLASRHLLRLPSLDWTENVLLPESFQKKELRVPRVFHTLSDSQLCNNNQLCSKFSGPCTRPAKTCTEAFHISGPVPSPIIKGMVGLLGTVSFPLLIVIF